LNVLKNYYSRNPRVSNFFALAIQNSGVIEIDATTNGVCSRKRKENLRNKGQSVNAEIWKLFCAGGSSIRRVNTVEQPRSFSVGKINCILAGITGADQSENDLGRMVCLTNSRNASSMPLKLSSLEDPKSEIVIFTGKERRH
jgi:hypothetical protein